MPFGAFGKASLLGPMGGVPTSFPANWYLGLTTANPGPTVSLASEFVIGTNAYARLVAPNDIATWNGPQAGAFTNSLELVNAIDLVWPVSSGAQGDALYVIGCDAPTGGNGWWYYAVPGGAFPVDRAGIALLIAAGSLHLDLADS